MKGEKELHEIEFGWLPEKHSYPTDLVYINPLKNYDEAVNQVRGLPESDGHWFYAHSIEAKCIRPIAMFELPSTHVIRALSSDSCDEQGLAFFITMLGFCKGLALLPSTEKYYFRTAVHIGELTGIYASPRETERFLCCVDRCLQKHNPDTINRIMRIVKLYLAGQSLEPEDTKFIYQYIVLDAIYALVKPKLKNNPKTHAGRISALIGRFGLKPPSWAIMFPKNRGSSKKEYNALSEIRNVLFHEGKYDSNHVDQTGHKANNLPLEMTDFNARLITALLGYGGEFTESSSQTRSYHGFKGTYDPGLAL